MGNRFSFESDSDVVKLVLKLDASHPDSLVAATVALPMFKSKEVLSNGDILVFYEDSFA